MEDQKSADGRSRWFELFDVCAKLMAAGAVVFASFIANNFQSSMSTASLLNQREQADSALRTSMFHDLIGPIVGSEMAGGSIDAERERLLVELLALNFHEHFEFKPLMLHVDERLARERGGVSNKPAERDASRESLRSIARRVLQRQIAMLTKAESVALANQHTCVYRVELEERPPQAKENGQGEPQPCSTISRYFGDLISVTSPSGSYTLAFTLQNPDWENQSFRVFMRITPAASNQGAQTTSTYADQDFRLTWFDFPFTDNTLLADGTRFALVLDDVRLKDAFGNPRRKATFKLIWFPRDYFSPRERPVNYREFRERLGLEMKY